VPQAHTISPSPGHTARDEFLAALPHLELTTAFPLCQGEPASRQAGKLSPAGLELELERRGIREVDALKVMPGDVTRVEDEVRKPGERHPALDQRGCRIGFHVDEVW